MAGELMLLSGSKGFMMKSTRFKAVAAKNWEVLYDSIIEIYLYYDIEMIVRV